ncbi:hypothetical protein [Leptothoe kymatousa]|uniref:Uncharacterized protein n=1 Tax=Leptothoe kymatousa TAU-MAC 1615 TaxID=2364775 RepID=A0ABS5Y1G2_9CYAN|nr:hypothetical protein [Leptothoe kymatousa]MBT9311662.1 hypothetical protein [Leptothoe kymatousa TAU-MAC 1615]
MTSQTRALSSQTSSLDKAVMASLAALAMFVAGYTVVRVSLAQPVASNADAADIVIPHEAELWADLAE